MKAQVHAGGRGKAGGVKLCNSEHEIQDATNAMLERITFNLIQIEGDPRRASRGLCCESPLIR